MPWNSFAPPTLHVGDVLSLRVSARFGTDTGGSNCDPPPFGRSPGLRVYYDTLGNNSRFAATITPDPSVDLSLHAQGTACDAAKPKVSNRTLSQDLPPGTGAKCDNSNDLGLLPGNVYQTVANWKLAPQCDCANQFIPEVRDNPPAPAPEPVSVSELPLPPTAPSTTAGSCANPTGCIDGSDSGLSEGPAYMWDGHHVLLPVSFAGAPSGSIYAGSQVIAVKTDGTTFSNGDSWKCITCGIPDANKVGADTTVDHPQAFHDGKRAVVGTNVLDCSPFLITDDACTASREPTSTRSGSTPPPTTRAPEDRSASCACTPTTCTSASTG